MLKKNWPVYIIENFYFQLCALFKRWKFTDFSITEKNIKNKKLVGNLRHFIFNHKTTKISKADQIHRSQQSGVCTAQMHFNEVFVIALDFNQSFSDVNLYIIQIEKIIF